MVLVFFLVTHRCITIFFFLLILYVLTTTTTEQTARKKRDRPQNPRDLKRLSDRPSANTYTGPVVAGVSCRPRTWRGPGISAAGDEKRVFDGPYCCPPPPPPPEQGIQTAYAHRAAVATAACTWPTVCALWPRYTHDTDTDNNNNTPLPCRLALPPTSPHHSPPRRFSAHIFAIPRNAKSLALSFRRHNTTYFNPRKQPPSPLLTVT